MRKSKRKFINTNLETSEKDKSLREINSFFGLLTGTLHLENRISKLFQACFVHSVSFRRTFFNTIKKKTNLFKVYPRDISVWDCLYQPHTPNTTALRPDLLIYKLSTQDPFIDKTSIFIESKIYSPLREQQLKKYRNNGVKNLIAITKNLPEISVQKIERLKVYQFRWQDFHFELKSIKYESQHDRFICKHFIHLLEEAEMAYDQALTIDDLYEIGKTFYTISKSSYASIGRFEYRLNCISRCESMLSEVALELRHHYQKLANTKKWSGYYHDTDDHGKIDYHILQYSLYNKSFNKTQFSWGLWFPNDTESSIEWSIFYYYNGELKGEKVIYLENIAKKNVIDTSILAKSVIDCAKKWKVIL
ncbi:hypothetical protein ACFLS9_00655 [Bacteroidota bacterium]